MIDAFLETLEQPVINEAVIGKSSSRVSEIPILARQARRRVEVLVYSADKKSWRQTPIEADKTTSAFTSAAIGQRASRGPKQSARVSLFEANRCRCGPQRASRAGGKMRTGRLEAFSDGVIAIIITIMVLEMKVPHGATSNDLLPVLPVFLSYVLSFVYVGIYWNNHHHLLHATTRVTGAILWANLHLLFWLSLFPFATGWMGENHFSELPSALYGVVLLMAAIAYFLLQQAIIRSQGPDSILKRAVGRDWKGKLSPLLYMAAILAAFLSPWVAEGIFVAAALIWLIPDRRIESVLPRSDV